MNQPLVPIPPTLKTHSAQDSVGEWQEVGAGHKTTLHHFPSSLADEHFKEIFPQAPERVSQLKLSLGVRIDHITNAERKLHSFSFISKRGKFTYLTHPLECSPFGQIWQCTND